MPRPTSSFAFPGWSVEFSSHGETPATEARDQSANDKDWLDDLEELDDDTENKEETPKEAEIDVTDAVEVDTPGAAAPDDDVLNALPTARGFYGGWPEDVLFAVLTKLATPQALCTARAVAMAWRETASSDALWNGVWTRNERFARRPPRVACGRLACKALLPDSGRQQPEHEAFWRFALRSRAEPCYRWVDLQVGWDRLEQLLQPGLDESPAHGGHAEKKRKAAPASPVEVAEEDATPQVSPQVSLEQSTSQQSTSQQSTSQQSTSQQSTSQQFTSQHSTSQRGGQHPHQVAIAKEEIESSLHRQIRADELLAQQMQTSPRELEPSPQSLAPCAPSPASGGGHGTMRDNASRARSGGMQTAIVHGDDPVRRAADGGSGARRRQAQRLAGILTTRDWELLYDCVLVLQREFAHSIARSIELDPASPRNAQPPGGHAVDSSSPRYDPLQGSYQADASHGIQHGIPSAEMESCDERLLVRLLAGWRVYARWLNDSGGAFTHSAQTPCSHHLVCIVSAQRASEQVAQNTPSLMHAGFAAFRGVVLLRPSIELALRRHIHRAATCIMAQGGFTSESGRLMQQLIDLQEVLTALDVRDDHLCEERGERFTQDHCRERFLLPLSQLWDEHSRSWFCGTKINPDDVGFYVNSRQDRRRRRQHDLERAA